MDKKPEITRVGGCYWNQKDAYVRRPLWGLSRTIKANKADACVVIEYEPIKF